MPNVQTYTLVICVHQDWMCLPDWEHSLIPAWETKGIVNPYVVSVKLISDIKILKSVEGISKID